MPESNPNLSLLLLLVGLSTGLACPAAAAARSTALPGVADPLAEFGRRLQSERVAGQPLSGFLEELDASGCLRDVQAELVPALESLRLAYLDAADVVPERRLWARLRRQLDAFSEDGALLVATWLDSPASARESQFCSDAFPPSWLGLSAERYVVDAPVWFELSALEAIAWPDAGSLSTSLARLFDEKASLLRRFDRQYPRDGHHDELRSLLEARLAVLWSRFVLPRLDAQGSRVDEGPPASGVGGTPVRLRQNPFYAADIPDPEQLGRSTEIHGGWMKQLRTLKGEALRLRLVHDRLFPRESEALQARRSSSADGRLVSGVALETALALLHAEVEALKAKVRPRQGRSPMLRALLAARPVPHTLAGLRRLEHDVVAQRDRLTAELASELRHHPRWLVAESPLASAMSSAGAGQLSGPSGWSVSSGPSSQGVPGRERVYDGPLVAPSEGWSGTLVEAIRRRSPALDRTDVLILLGLVEVVFPELRDRSDVELAIRVALLQPGGLLLTGDEWMLSELWRPAAAPDEQVRVSFRLHLR